MCPHIDVYVPDIDVKGFLLDNVSFTIAQLR
jgi:hypothetical protein